MEDQPKTIRFGWVNDNKVKPDTYEKVSEAITYMGKYLGSGGSVPEGEILQHAEKAGFRLVLVECQVKVVAFMCPYPL